jgi:uroporphyrinogen decarboxylase
MTAEMTPLQRVLTALGHKEPDRVPFFLPTYLQGARELGIGIREYFSRAENVVAGQLRLAGKHRADSVSSFFYASLEIEAWGGETVFFDDGPPNAGAPIIRSPEEIERLVPPRVAECKGLLRSLSVARELKAQIGEATPIIGVVMSPFSLPVMQMGFEAYLDLVYDRPGLLDRLLRVNEEFCVEWANAQLAAGATAIVYFDPLCSPTMVSPDLSRQFGFPVARRTIGRFKGPAATHLASGRCLPVVEDLVRTGTLAVGVSAAEDLGELKSACRGKLALVGNLNALEMRRWTPSQVEEEVKRAIAKAGAGGGFILSDNHGEIPWQVPDDVLMGVAEAVRRWGRYPLRWAEAGNEP